MSSIESSSTGNAGETATAAGHPDTLVHLTAHAARKVREFAGANAAYQGKLFRVYIEGGGCSGFQYGFTFDEPREGDTRVPAEGVEVLVDPQSAMYLGGSTVDYVEGLTGAGFVVRNPNASGSCGCGQSFSV